MKEKFTWVTNTREKPDSEINCQNCDGVIIFSSAEILRARQKGTNTSTPCKHCGYHPGFPPEPWRKLDESEIKHLGYAGQYDESTS